MTNISDTIRERIKLEGARYWAGDNISKYINDDEYDSLINELSTKFEGVLHSLVIDTDNDPNSKGTARRLAKMYVNEIMSGRYYPAPDATAFPNNGEDRYEGMLVVRSELKSSAVIITSQLPVLLTLVLSQHRSLLDLVNIHVLRSGVLVEEHCKKNFAMILLARSRKQQVAKMLLFTYRHNTVAVKTEALWQKAA